MAASFDIAARAFNLVAAATLTSGSLTPSGSDRVMYAWVTCGAGTPRAPDTVKFNTTESFTKLTDIAVGGFRNLSLWRLINPTAAAATVVADWTTSVDERQMLVMSFTDVNQSTPNGTVATNTGTGLTPTVSVVTVNGYLTADGFYFLESGGPTNQTLTAGAGQTSRQEIDGTDIGDQGMGCSTEVAAGTSTTMSWTISGGATDSWGTIGFNINSLSDTLMGASCL